MDTRHPRNGPEMILVQGIQADAPKIGRGAKIVADEGYRAGLNDVVNGELQQSMHCRKLVNLYARPFGNRQALRRRV